MSSNRLADLDAALKALGIPIIGVVGTTPPAVQYDVSATPSQIAQGDALAAGWDMTPRRKRTLYAIWQQLNGLTATQQSNIWTDITSGAPPRWALDAGPNAAGIMSLHWSAVNSGATAANLNDARRRLVAMYCQDNVNYLVNPAFDNTINVSGEEPDI